jgi:hypothetical protein
MLHILNLHSHSSKVSQSSECTQFDSLQVLHFVQRSEIRKKRFELIILKIITF